MACEGGEYDEGCYPSSLSGAEVEALREQQRQLAERVAPVVERVTEYLAGFDITALAAGAGAKMQADDRAGMAWSGSQPLTALRGRPPLAPLARAAAALAGDVACPARRAI